MLAQMKSLWLRYLNSGSRHFSTPTDLKLNRVLNLLFSLHYFAGGFLIVTEIVVLIILLNRDFDKYIQYALPFFTLNVVHFVSVAIVIYAKNRWGNFQVSFISDAIYTAYCITLSVFLGETVAIHIILLSVLPVVFTVFNYGRWKEALLHAAFISVGIALSLMSYRLIPPLYPLPPDIAQVSGYLAYAVGIILIFIYSTYNWKQVYDTEQQLEHEKNYTHSLLNEAIPKLEMAEANYRYLIENSSDMIFQMNAEGQFLSMNKTSRDILSFLPEEMIGKSLFDFIAEMTEGKEHMDNRFVHKHLQQLIDGKKIVSFKMTLRKKHMQELVVTQVTLHKPDFSHTNEFLGKISRLEQDITRQFIEREKGRYSIGNNITYAEALSQKLAEKLWKYFDSSTINTIRICLREILVNAIEHGNLAISFQDKSRIIAQHDYMEFLFERQKDSKYASRRVHVDFLINQYALFFRVTDEGDGFDHRTFLERAARISREDMLEHGRGILMTRNAFDSVTYNDKGNQVILTKQIPK
ncbi:MAG TPA: ATP-binding protein [Turneriella sp.]|nr:ATP-binding protein [Turneriella sp.]